MERCPITNRFGFVGTLNHPPNEIALSQIFELIQNKKLKIEIRLVGSGLEKGMEFSKKFSFVTYLGKLDDESLRIEIGFWSYFLNPIFWYSRGASMKLAKALEWGLPLITTKAGRRGYIFKKNILEDVNNNPFDFVEKIEIAMSEDKLVEAYKSDCFFSSQEISEQLTVKLLKL